MLSSCCIDCINRKNYINKYANELPNPTPHYNEMPINNLNPNTNIDETNNPNQFFVEAPGSPVILGNQYTEGYLRTIIGKKILVEFLIGTNGVVDRSGILEEVGISYIIIRETETNELLLCDEYSIKFVTIYK